MEYKYAAGILETETRIYAQVLSDYINKNPDLWKFRIMKMEGYLSWAYTQNMETRRIIDAKGNILVMKTDNPSKPLLIRHHDIFEAGIVAGRIEISHSIRHIYIRTLMAFLFGLALGGAVWYMLRAYPLRALKEAFNMLETKVKERTRELEAEKLLAESANVAKSNFLANMSHELRTPLNAILGFADIMRMGMAGPVNDKQMESLNDIYSSGTHLLELITDILDLSKIEAGKMELEYEEFTLKELVDASLIMFREKASKHGLIATAEIDDAITSITADKRKLKQVIVNLLSNAFKFTPDGGSVSVKVRKLSSSELRVRSSESQSINSELIIQDSKLSEGAVSELRTQYSELNTDLVEISVEDTGIGISSENQQRLFQPFQQIETSLTRKFAGTGLGLSLCRRFVELHGGRIWVESEVGKGSTFAFVIPVRQEDKQVERIRTKGQQ